jgi:hypothetical protein
MQINDEEELIVFKVDPDRDPDGSKFRQLLTAHLAYERARGFRWLLVQVLLVVTVVLGLQVLNRFPSPHWLEVLLRAACAIVVVALASTTFSEWRWRAERERCLAELQPGGPQQA